MGPLHIKSTSKTPEVFFNPQSGVLSISGSSLSENPYQFYASLMEWLDEYICRPCKNTIIRFQLDYFNTSSSMFIFSILRKLEGLITQEKQVKAQWYCVEDDEAILQSGKDLRQIAKIPIEIFKINSDII